METQVNTSHFGKELVKAEKAISNIGDIITENVGKNNNHPICSNILVEIVRLKHNVLEMAELYEKHTALSKN